MTLAHALAHAADRLRHAGIDNPRLNARLLLAHALRLSPSELLARRDHPLPPAFDAAAFDALLARREAREPVALIVGRKEFWSLDFAVSPATLVPRPDSEAVVAAALEPGGPPIARVLDLGTGTGCLLLSVLHERPTAWGLGLDRSPVAAALARANAVALGLAARAQFAVADWSAPIAPGTRFDRVLANPPYIETAALGALMPDVARFEPPSALDGGPDGLDAYRQIIPALPDLLAPGGRAALEVGHQQAAAVVALVRAAGLAADTRPDLSGIDRVVLVRHIA